MTGPIRRGSIALPIFSLTIVSVVLTAILLFVVTFNGPPPRAAPVRVEVIAQALRSGTVPHIADQKMEMTQGTRATMLPSHAGRAPETERRLAGLLGRPPGDVVVVTFEPQREPFTIRGPFSAGVRANGGWRVLATRPPGLLTRWHLWTLQAMALACIVLGIIAWLIARAITRPLAELAQAASRGGVARTIAVPTDGPREVRALGEALSAMHGRLAAHVESRTTMLAAIAHDLGTPLSRIAFWIEQLPEEARSRAATDIDEMRAMLGDVLRFARDERFATDTTIDLGSVLDALVDDLAVSGQPVTLTTGERVLVKGDAAALRRLFANLIDNAIRYGETCHVGWLRDHGSVTVTIDDAGPGVDPRSAESLFQPFVRGDPSRNRATGGTGLGLAIVRSLAEAHGGTVTLGTEGGHGRAIVVLPIA